MIPLLIRILLRTLKTCPIKIASAYNDSKFCYWREEYMLSFIEKAVLGMVILRLLSGSIEITAALLMLKANEIEKALIINSSLAIVGPLVLIATTFIGL